MKACSTVAKLSLHDISRVPTMNPVTKHRPTRRKPDIKRIARELKQPRRRRQQERHKFAYLTMKNGSSARYSHAFFIFGHFKHVLVLSTCFAVVWTTRAYDDKCSIFSSYL